MIEMIENDMLIPIPIDATRQTRSFRPAPTPLNIAQNFKIQDKTPMSL